MLARALAVTATVIVPAAVALAPALGLEIAQPLVPVVLAVVLVLATLAASRRRASNVLVAAVLAGIATQQAHGTLALLAVTAEEPGDPIHDLRTGPLPASASGIVRVQGYLRDEWSLDEYRVETEERPDQNEAPHAVLAPFVGSEADVLEAGRVVVVRIRGDHELGGKLQTLQGEIGPVAPELLASLISASSPEAQAKIEGVLLDTMSVPTRDQVITRIALAAVSSMVALILLLLAGDRRRPRGGPVGAKTDSARDS